MGRSERRCRIDETQYSLGASVRRNEISGLETAYRGHLVVSHELCRRDYIQRHICLGGGDGETFGQKGVQGPTGQELAGAGRGGLSR